MTRYTVGKITPIQRREVRATDFGPRASFWMAFPKEGSQLTPPHYSEDFKWKDYCPMVFRFDVYNLFLSAAVVIENCELSEVFQISHGTCFMVSNFHFRADGKESWGTFTFHAIISSYLWLPHMVCYYVH